MCREHRDAGTTRSKLGRRRVLVVSMLFLGVAVVSAVGACAESDRFEFKPRGVDSPIRHGG